MGYKYAALVGISWITLFRILTRLLTFVRLAVLGRLLTPAQFGYFGIAALLLSLLEILTETGINVFLVQKKGNINEYINSAWIVSIARGILLALIVFLSASFIATFFNSPDSYPVLVLVAIVPFIRGFINPAIISYQKDLHFQKEFQLRFFLFFTDVAISIIAGYVLRSPSAFVYGLIASALIEVLLSYKLFSLWPRFQFEYVKVKQVISRGWWVTLTGVFSYFSDNGDNLVVGKILGSSSLGIYQIAYKFSTLPISEVTNVVNQVIFPVYAKFSDDKVRLRRAFHKVITLSSLVAFVLGGCIFFFARSIILIFMGEQWTLAIPAIQILAIYGILRTIFGNFSPLFLSMGRQDYVARMTLFRVIGLSVVIVPSILSFGMVGAGYAMLFSIIFEIPVILYFAYKIFSNTK